MTRAARVARDLMRARLPAPRGARSVPARTEALRAEFADWVCLPEELHQRFHRALPPVR